MAQALKCTCIFSLSSRYFGFDVGDPIYDAPDAAAHLKKQLIMNALQVSRCAIGSRNTWLIALWVVALLTARIR